MDKSYEEIVEMIEEFDYKKDSLDIIGDLRDLLPQLQYCRVNLLEMLSKETDRFKKQEIHDSLYDVRKITREINFKMNKIARSKMKRPNFNGR